MKKSWMYLFAVIVLSASACTGENKTGGAQADSGKTNIGSSGPADTASVSSSSTKVQTGTSGTDTSSTGNGAAAPTVDTTGNKPK